jgi:hypothetical protein
VSDAANGLRTIEAAPAGRLGVFPATETYRYSALIEPQLRDFVAVSTGHW